MFKHITKIGMPKSFEFVDIYGLERDLLEMVSQTSKRIAAVILLFPCSSAIYTARRLEEKVLRRHMNINISEDDRDDPNNCDDIVKPHHDAFFLVQHGEFGNACGTIACMHAITNAGFEKEVNNNTPLTNFCNENANATPSERGRALLHTKSLKMSSDSQAQSNVAQTSCPERDGPDLDHHFVSFSLINGRLVELDGTKLCAIDHGAVVPVNGQGFLLRAVEVIQRNFMNVDPENIEFSLMALREGNGNGES